VQTTEVERGSVTALGESSVGGGEHESPSESGAYSVLEASRIGRYRILRELGSGGMGIVYAAYDESLDRRVALKLLLRETSTTAQRLRREAQAMARISHTNVIQIFEVGEHRGHPFVAMEYIDGISLTRWLSETSLAWFEIIDVFIRAGRGLQAAHEAGVVHRDFKPDNVMLARSDDGRLQRVKVLDFGIAAADFLSGETTTASLVPDRDLSSRLTRAGALMGTPNYMSPEHFLGNATDPRSDQFSFAVALFEALYGQRPFDGDDVEGLRAAVLAGVLRPAPKMIDVPAWVFETLTRALAVDPNQRWGSMAELLEALANHPDRTANPELDRTVALPQRLWMLCVLTLGTLGLLATLLFVRASGSATQFEGFAFWSKVLFSSSACVALLAMKHVFQRNSYNGHVFAMLMALSLTLLTISISARATGLPAEQADRFALIAIAAIFGQASTTVGKWLLAIPAVAVAGLVSSFALPFVASPALGLCSGLGTGMTVYFWIRRRKTPAGGSSTSRTSSVSHDDPDPV
jgi:eukaryotic-like serine/threonine-protein kinase